MDSFNWQAFYKIRTDTLTADMPYYSSHSKNTIMSQTKNQKNTVELVRPVTAKPRDVHRKRLRVQHSLATRLPLAEAPIAGLDAMLKRVLDCVVGGLALLVLLPFLALLSILIKLDSTGPALFYQQRKGQHREIIKVYKFRTMYQDFSTPLPTNTSFKQTEKDDPRITRIGAFMRRTSLDELPQLFNVVQGSMSLVGPRPHPSPLDDQYKLVIPELDSRYVVKPGLTGWAQINGFRGETLRLEDMVGRVEYDRYYIRNWTLWLDIKIIVRTAFKGWTHHNAY